MPIYRTGLDRYKKLEAKWNPTVIGTRFSDIKALALERAQEGLLDIGTVTTSLDQYLTPTVLLVQ